MARTKSNGTNPSTATIGFEAKLWLTADKLRNNMDAAEYIHHLAPQGMAGFVLANGSMSSNQSGEGDIRRFMTSRKPLSFCRRNQTTILEVAA